MLTSSLKDVLKYLPQLSKKELREVRQRIDFLAGKQEAEDWLRAGLVAELKRRGLTAGNPKITVEGYVQKNQDISKFLLEGYSKEVPPYVERLALAQFAGSNLANYLIKCKVPLSPKTLLTNIEKIPVALEESFPGYWAARALSICIGR